MRTGGQLKMAQKVITALSEIFAPMRSPESFSHNFRSSDVVPVSEVTKFLLDYGAVVLGGDVASNNFFFGNNGYNHIGIYSVPQNSEFLISEIRRISANGKVKASLGGKREFIIRPSTMPQIDEEDTVRGSYDFSPVPTFGDKLMGKPSNIQVYVCSKDKFEFAPF